jgi:hypothetical protein
MEAFASRKPSPIPVVRSPGLPIALPRSTDLERMLDRCLREPWSLDELAAALPLLPSSQSGPQLSEIDGRLASRREFPAVVLPSRLGVERVDVRRM